MHNYFRSLLNVVIRRPEELSTLSQTDTNRFAQLYTEAKTAVKFFGQ